MSSKIGVSTKFCTQQAVSCKLVYVNWVLAPFPPLSPYRSPFASSTMHRLHWTTRSVTSPQRKLLAQRAAAARWASDRVTCSKAPRPFRFEEGTSFFIAAQNSRLSRPPDPSASRICRGHTRAHFSVFLDFVWVGEPQNLGDTLHANLMSDRVHGRDARGRKRAFASLATGTARPVQALAPPTILPLQARISGR